MRRNRVEHSKRNSICTRTHVFIHVYVYKASHSRFITLKFTAKEGFLPSYFRPSKDKLFSQVCSIEESCKRFESRPYLTSNVARIEKKNGDEGLSVPC